MSRVEIEKFYEVGGKSYEAIVSFLLKKLGYQFDYNIEGGTYITSDFLVKTNGKLIAVILVTHSTSPDGGHMKFWRDLEELFEFKSTYGPKFPCFQLVFYGPNGWYPQHLAIFTCVFDEAVILFKKKFGLRLLRILHPYFSKFEKLSIDKIEVEIQKICEKNKKFAELLNRFKDMLGKMIEGVAPPSLELEQLWEAELNFAKTRTSPPNFYFEEETYYKRGFIKSCSFSNKELEVIRNCFDTDGHCCVSKPKKEFCQLVEKLKILRFITETPTLRGVDYFLDKELNFVIQRMGIQEIKGLRDSLIKKYTKFRSYLLDILYPSRVIQMIDFLTLKMRNGISSEKIAQMLIECFYDENYGSIDSKRNWLFELIIRTIHLCEPKSKFSYNVLARETRNPEIIKNGRFIFPAFAHGKTLLEDNVLDIVCKVLASQLNSIGVSKIRQKRKEIQYQFLRERINTLNKLKTINALKEYILMKLEKYIDHSLIDQNVTEYCCFSEYCNVDKIVGSTLISFRLNLPRRTAFVHVVSGYGGAANKRKEIASRIRTIRYRWNGKEFEERKFKSILILDGTWLPSKTIKMLYEAGWDVVAYPHHMEKIFGRELLKYS